MCHAFQSTNPRDKVYATLGVAHDRREMAIVPNYDESVETVYQNVAARLIQVHADLDLFSSVYAERAPGL